jgi:lipoate-protein ligase B
VDPDLADFGLIDPCGMPGLVSTSIAAEAGRPEEPPSTPMVERAAAVFARALAGRLGADLVGFGEDDRPLPRRLGDPLTAGR